MYITYSTYINRVLLDQYIYTILMEKTAASGVVIKKKQIAYVYVLIGYNNDDNYDADVVGVYKNAEKAKEALIERIHQDFINCDGETDSDDSDIVDSDEDEDENDDTDDEQENNSTKKGENARDVINDLHRQYPNALSAPRVFEHEEKNAPGFDKKNWDHMKPLIIKELDTYKKGYWEYENKYSYLNYKVCKKAVNIQ